MTLKSFLASIKINSIKFKVSVLYTVILGAILLMFSVVLYAILSYYLSQDIDKRLKVKAVETMATITSFREIAGDKPGALQFAVEKTFFYDTGEFPIGIFERGNVKRLETRWKERADAMGIKDNYTVFIFANPQLTLKSKDFPPNLLPAYLEIFKSASRQKKPDFYNVRFKKEPLRIITIPYMGNDEHGGILEIGMSQAPAEQLLQILVQAAVLGIPLVLALTSFVGFFFVKSILDPIEEIVRTADQISQKDLSLRVKSQHLDAEIEYLVASFNNMIGRLERSFEHINEFSSQVAHELKTPLAIIKGEAEIALSAERSNEEYKRAIRINLEEANRMRKTIGDLLMLARLDYQPEIFQFQSIDFMEFFQEICEQTEILVAEKGLTVKVAIPKQKVFINADKLHLRRMFFNVIDNAIKFTLPPGVIKMQVIHKGNKLLVAIADTGAGIPEEDLPNIFKKFYHSDRTGTNDGRCSGLGLSIVRSILHIHKGRIHVASKVGVGTTFHIMLPA